MYTEIDYNTKKALKTAVANGDRVRIYQPGPFGQGFVDSGSHCVEGPQYPRPHRWYASVVVRDGAVVKVS